MLKIGGGEIHYLDSYRGTREEVLTRYQDLLTKLGHVSTEAERRREMTQSQQGMQVNRANHMFAFPADIDALLESNPEEYYDKELGTVVESKTAPMHIFVNQAMGVWLDLTAEPPVVTTYDASGAGSSAGPELMRASAPPVHTLSQTTTF